MLPVALERVIELLREFAGSRKTSLQILLLGGLALQHYGMKDRATIDVDAEVEGEMEEVFTFLKANNIPADMGENISGWSVVAMPQGYRERAIEIYRDAFLKVKVLHPLDFIIAKLRRFTEEDIEDAIFVARKYHVEAAEIKRSAEIAIRNSPRDTALFVFRKNVDIFLSRLQS